MESVARVVSYLDSAAYEEAAAREVRAGHWPFVTISRQACAGGSSLALDLIARMGRLNDELFRGWHALDREICEAVARDPRLSVTLDALAREEFRGPWADYLSQVFADSSPQLAVLRRIIRLQRGAASLGKTILVGRAASLVTRDFARGVHVRLVAPLPARLARLMRQRELARENALPLLEELDEARRRLVRDHFHREIDDPLLYDAVLNMEHLTLDDAADLVIELVRQRMSKALQEPFMAPVEPAPARAEES